MTATVLESNDTTESGDRSLTTKRGTARSERRGRQVVSYLELLGQLGEAACALRGLQKDLEILGRLPSLHRLDLEVDHDDLGIVGRFFIGPGFFPFLVCCGLFGFAIPVVFQHGGMPRLKAFEFEFSVREANEIVCSDSGFYMGLGNLQSLKRVKAAWLLSRDTSEQEVAEAKAAVIHAVEIHPNRPRLRIRR
ncbi:hypothetical protein PR202_ga22537 [Eleusine coracana subsp. coracana]|uniref:Disease resistance R13L4/SHOC-2-like LRR domain-containing protein n=1 Tax=Eleusine coracana subsp. coracana TaxID=191504 RepID=A0AAV5D2Y5_ELECO|nr:hypothetical protein PR202_ga22537 [Eleusine coracana subsp. coracana]